jgi:oxaloacetate decarboxylase alpha subunit
MARTIRIVDTTLRDGHQCLWATRMPTAMMLPIADAFDRAGFWVVEMIGAVQFDACMRFIGENPWHRVRELRRRISGPFQAILRSNCALNFDRQPVDINELWAELLFRNGVDRIVGFDGLHDYDNTAPALIHAKKLGATTAHWLLYSHSPVHTDELYVRKAREIIDRADVDELIIEDASGVLTPERAATLVPALRAEIGDMPLGLHMHSLVSLPQRTYLEAVKHGVDNLYCCVWPIADGNAPPAVQTTVRNLRYAGYDVTINDVAVDEISRHFESQAFLHDKPVGEVTDFDLAHFDHQIPGGVLSNLGSQLAAVGLEHKLPQVLDECSRVREELGWPIQVTPFAQFMAVQATFNAIHEDRYSVVPDEIKKYALGYFGKPLAPIDPDVMDRIVSRGSKKIALEVTPLEPAVERLRRRYPGMSDEERFLRYSFAEEICESTLAKPPVAEPPALLSAHFVDLMKALRDMNSATFVSLSQGDVEIELRR